jgi:hypothetical protein
VELPVGSLIGLLHPHDPLYVFVEEEIVAVQLGGIPYQAENGTAYTVSHPYLKVLSLKFLDHSLNIFPAGAGF